MDMTELKRIAESNIREISHLSQMQVFATSYYQKNYFQMQIDHRVAELMRLFERNEAYAMEEGYLQGDFIQTYQPGGPNQADQQEETIPTEQQEEPIPADQQEEPVPIDQSGVPVLMEFTAEDLATFNGEEGRPVYVAVGNKVYDLSTARPWEGGKHNGLTAGQDLSEWFMNCHMGVTGVLEKYPQVGILISDEGASTW